MRPCEETGGIVLETQEENIQGCLILESEGYRLLARSLEGSMGGLELSPIESDLVIRGLKKSAQDRRPWNSPMWETHQAMLNDYEAKSGYRP